MSQLVEFKKVQELSLHTAVYQVDDGTIFYFEHGSSRTQRLFVDNDGDEIEAEYMPTTHITTVAAFGNAVYFESARKIYKAVFVNNDIEVTMEQELPENVIVDNQGLCNLLYETGRKYVFRMCDDVTDGIIVDVASTGGYMQERIHKSVLYVVKRSEWEQTEMEKMGEEIVGLRLPLSTGAWHSHCKDTSPYLYISNGHSLYTLDVETKENLPTLDFGSDIACLKIVGVFHDRITASMTDGRGRYLIIAHIPEGFYDKRTPAATFTKKCENPQKDLKQRFTSSTKMEVDEDAYLYRASAKDTNTSRNRSFLFNEHYGAGSIKMGEDDQLAAAIAASLEDVKQSQAHATVENMPQEMDCSDSIKKVSLDDRIKEMEKELDKKSGSDTVDNSANEKYLDQALQKFDKEFQPTASESAEDKKRREYEAEMSATINDLIIKNMELTQQIDDLNKKKQENEDAAELALVELCERNSELTKKHKELETLNWELTNELDRTEDLNEELEAANERLSKEKEELIKKNEEMEKEESAKIEELVADIAKIKEEIEEMNEDTSTVDSPDDIEVLKRKIEMVRKQNEQMSTVLTQNDDSSSGEEYEIIDDIINDPKSTEAH